jgi:hypothetical protein
MFSSTKRPGKPGAFFCAPGMFQKATADFRPPCALLTRLKKEILNVMMHEEAKSRVSPSSLLVGECVREGDLCSVSGTGIEGDLICTGSPDVVHCISYGAEAHGWCRRGYII